MNRFAFWNGRLLTMLLGVFCVYAAHTQTRTPNIIIIYVDDLGYADLSVQGIEKHTADTP